MLRTHLRVAPFYVQHYSTCFERAVGSQYSPCRLDGFGANSGTGRLPRVLKARAAVNGMSRQRFLQVDVAAVWAVRKRGSRRCTP